MTPPPIRLGILGGTFDPIHAGHLALARACAAAVELDEVRLLANRRPPHKPPAEAGEFHRHAMAALAAAGDPLLVADPRELERAGTSYTVDTLAALRVAFPQTKLFFLGGADALRDLSTWMRWRELLARATFVAVRRHGVLLEEALSRHRDDFAAGRIMLVDHEPPPWSSRELRASLRAGTAAPGALPPLVLDYVRRNGLYAHRPPPSEEVLHRHAGSEPRG